MICDTAPDEGLQLGQQASQVDSNFQGVESRQFRPEVKDRVRKALASNNLRLHEISDDLIRGRMEEQAFLTEYDRIEQQEDNWGTISKLQRSTRKNIATLHERAESYSELLPQKAREFEKIVKNIRKLNSDDDRLDGEMKTMLFDHTKETQDASGTTIPPILTSAQAEKLYLLDPNTIGFDKKFNALAVPILATDGGRQTLDRLRTLKREERRIEQQFRRYTKEVEGRIKRNVNKVRREAEKKKVLQTMTRGTGINVKIGTKINYVNTDIIGSVNNSETTEITGVTFKEVPIKDESGKIIGYTAAMPQISLKGFQYPLTYARFKKWIDASDAVEEIASIGDLAQKIGWKTIGQKLEKGTTLEYQKIERDREGNIRRIPQKVFIRDIKNGRILLNQSVLYQSGPSYGSQALEDEYRESLTFGEFLKWYQRNEVEKDMHLDDLRSALQKLNVSYNTTYGLKNSENPPINVQKGETLIYPDDSGLKVVIDKVAGDRVVLNNGENMTLPQFFYWVKNNFVQKVPKEEMPLTPIQLAEKKKKEELEKVRNEEDAIFAAELEEKDKLREKLAGEVESIGLGDYMSNVWWTTTFLSMKDVWNMLISVKEFIERKHKRRSQARYSTVGSVLPWIFGTEFKRINQSSETEEVNQYKDAMEDWGVFDIRDVLYGTNSKDEAKATLIVLTDKGELRWDDPNMWQTLNRLTARYTTRGAELNIPSPDKMPKNMSGEDMTRAAVDALWGDGTWSDWFSKNVSTYNTKKEAYAFKGNQLEGDPKQTGGLTAEMGRLLQEWKKGEYVNPHEYEELIDFALDAGKSSAEAKLFYIWSGMTVEQDKPGGGYGTLLHMDRVGQFDGKYLNRFPLLDYFTDKDVERPDGTVGPWRVEDMRAEALKYFPDDYKKGVPGIQFSSYMWHRMMFNEAYRTRLSKGLRSAEQIDHDDAHLFIPPASLEEIKMLVGSPGGGEKKYFTPEGYANAYGGFNQYFITLATTTDATQVDEDHRMQSLKDALKSFIVYDAIIDNRYEKKRGTQYARLSEHHFNRTPVVDSVKLSLHRDQLRNLILEVGRAYGKDFSSIYQKTGSTHDPEEARKQSVLEAKIDGVAEEEIAKLFQEDGGKKIVDTILRLKEQNPDNNNGLRGLRAISSLWDVKANKDNPDVWIEKAKSNGLL
jgi:hypothetical protein